MRRRQHPSRRVGERVPPAAGPVIARCMDRIEERAAMARGPRAKTRAVRPEAAPVAWHFPFRGSCSGPPGRTATGGMRVEPPPSPRRRNHVRGIGRSVRGDQCGRQAATTSAASAVSEPGGTVRTRDSVLTSRSCDFRWHLGEHTCASISGACPRRLRQSAPPPRPNSTVASSRQIKITNGNRALA